MQPDTSMTEVVLPDLGGWISGPSCGVPHPACAKCEDWTTVVRKDNVISPCPACQPDMYAAWLDARLAS